MCFDQVAPHNTVVNFKPVHFGDWPRIGSDMTDLSPEHVGVVTRTACLQRCCREPDSPLLLGVNWVMACHKG